MKYLIFSLLAFLTLNGNSKTKIIWLDDLHPETFSQGLRPVKAKTNYLSDTIRISGNRFNRGVGGITPCVFSFYLKGNAVRFMAKVGVDDAANKELSLSFFVIGDRKILFESGEMKSGDPPKEVNVDLKGIQRLGLLVTDKIGGIRNKRTYCNWADARFEMKGKNIPLEIPNDDAKYILTPDPSPQPRINSAPVFGATPGNPFLYLVAATGKRPVRFSAENLPEGLTLDPRTGIISGTIHKPGTYPVILNADNQYGKTTKDLKIIIGDTLALTPPMGWNGWNSWEKKIDQDKVIAAAKAMLRNGLINYGWTYINLDDTWQGARGGKNNSLQPNEKFPDLKKMIDTLHSMGFKAGLYSTPYVYSYAGYPGASSDFEKGGETIEPDKSKRKSSALIGKFRFEENDARQMAEWGVDFLKYDWRIDVESTKRMSQALKNSGRDIVFSLSNNAPFEQVEEWLKWSNMYRTGPDIKDNFTSLFLNTFTLSHWGPFTGPGHWADPDMMIAGKVSIGQELHDTRLTPNEQYSHVSMMSLLSAPMLIGCPPGQMDSFTLKLFSNSEVIDINQDPLGKAAALVYEENGIQVWLKLLNDGNYAVGLFNTGNFGATPSSWFRWGDEKPVSFHPDFTKIGLPGKWLLRDVWRQKDLGVYESGFKTEIPFHGVVFLRIEKTFSKR